MATLPSVLATLAIGILGCPLEPTAERSPAITCAAQDPAPPKKESQSRALHEYEMKAGFLFQFARYIQWPASAFTRESDPIVIGIVGTDPFGECLDRILKGSTVKGRTFKIVRFAEPADIAACHILFVPKTEGPRHKDIVKRIAGTPTLTVGEDSKFPRDGGAIAIVVKDEKPKLEINLQAAQRANLVIESKLLRVSEVIKEQK